MYEFAVTPAVTQIRRRGVEISEVAVGSLGAELELEPGDRIMRINGRVVRDYLDFRFQTGGESEFVIDVRKLDDITATMQRLMDVAMDIHGRVDMCRDINVGKMLRGTIYYLANFHPRVRSVAIVPLGLTRYVTDAFFTPVTRAFCRRTIVEV